ncbi:MAG: AraC family transcriptional regulator, partial [Pseudomonadota bacterium]|nr:AraC family transcriptional regulator [Pseudomonadota bacterium]
MATKEIHFSDLAEHHKYFGLPAPEHPLFSVMVFSPPSEDETTDCANEELAISTDFYSISLKNIISGELYYGRTKYDCKNGTMIFLSPKQVIRSVGLSVRSTGRSIVFHEDFVRGHPIKDEIKKYHYFSYAVNEALHLTPKEEQMMAAIIDQIEAEYHSNHDEFSKELILSQLSTLLKYANRFYRRQFLHRQEGGSKYLDKFVAEVERYMANKSRDGHGIPSVDEIASALAITPRYLSDALKVETGKTAVENLHFYLIDKAKDLLLASDRSVSS